MPGLVVVGKPAVGLAGEPDGWGSGLRENLRPCDLSCSIERFLTCTECVKTPPVSPVVFQIAASCWCSMASALCKTHSWYT